MLTKQPRWGQASGLEETASHYRRKKARRRGEPGANGADSRWGPSVPDNSQPELEEGRGRHGIPYAFDSVDLCLGVSPLTVLKLLQLGLVSHHVELRCQALHFMSNNTALALVLQQQAHQMSNRS